MSFGLWAITVYPLIMLDDPRLPSGVLMPLASVSPAARRK
jgi:hypothetical protein